MGNYLSFRKKTNDSFRGEKTLYITQRSYINDDMDSVSVFCPSCWEEHRHGDYKIQNHTKTSRAAHCYDYPGRGKYGYNLNGYYFTEYVGIDKYTPPPKKLAYASRMEGACYDSRDLIYISEAELRSWPGDELNNLAWSLQRVPACRTRYCGIDLFGVEFINTAFGLYVAVVWFDPDSIEILDRTIYEPVHSAKEANKFIKLFGQPECFFEFSDTQKVLDERNHLISLLRNSKVGV